MTTPRERAEQLIAGLRLISPTNDHDQLVKCIGDHIAAAVRDLLRVVGKPDRCANCGLTLYLVRPYKCPEPTAYSEATGLPHENCDG